jgi:hypothetical protein
MVVGRSVASARSVVDAAEGSNATAGAQAEVSLGTLTTLPEASNGTAASKDFKLSYSM